ncbi:MAG: holo-ACP synthase [Phycisphaeraceae bacterium]
MTSQPSLHAGERIVGHGIDLVEVERFARLLDHHADRADARLFTPGELEYAATNQKRRAEHLAVRFAAKEAALKALGTGWARGIAWTDVEVIRDGEGRPELRVTGRADEVAQERGITRWHVSLTHVRGMAMASVLAAGPA